jgi:negative regulator of replication initiation
MQNTERSDEIDRTLLLFLTSSPFNALSDASERYLSLLGWCATNYAGDFTDFVSHQESGHRYLMLSADAVHAAMAHNHARQIANTQFWAVMSLDPGSRKRFVRRLLEFIGFHDSTVTETCRVVDSPETEPDRPGAA